jgi:D-3-phosphoglycerate dehydrogenase
MARFKVVVTDYVFEKFEAEQEVLRAVGAELSVHQCKTQAEMREAVRDADGVLNTYLLGLDASVFATAPKLKVVVRYGIGLDTINVPDATKAGIQVANVPDYCIEEVSDHALALFLGLARKVVLSDVRVKGGQWSLSYVKPLKGITAMTAGIIGYGRIGRAIADRVRAFGPKVVFFDPAVKGATGADRGVSLEELLATSDAVFVQCPATGATRHLLNRERFAMMKQKPLVINTARGSIIDTPSIVWALETGLISGAGLDVLDDEADVTKSDYPLKKFDNVILTPHSAWFSSAAVARLQRKAAEEVARVLAGKRPLSLANPEVLEKK